MNDHLVGLNNEQREATDGPLLIVAGAGAGKTKTITPKTENSFLAYFMLKSAV